MSQAESLGWMMFTVGFLAAAATSMRMPPLWSWFVPALVLSVIGACIARKAAHGAHAETTPNQKSGEERTALSLLQSMLDQVDAVASLEESDAIKRGIEDLQVGLIATFVAERRRYLKDFGPVVFAHFFGAFARAERNVNRAWSATVDGHAVEAATSFGYARRSLEESISVLKSEGRQ